MNTFEWFVAVAVLALAVALVLAVSGVVARLLGISPWMLALPVIVLGLWRLWGGRWVTAAIALAAGLFAGLAEPEEPFTPALVGGGIFFFLRVSGGQLHEPDAPLVDFFVGALVGISLVTSAVAVLLGLVLVVACPEPEIFPAVGPWLLIPCIILDLSACYATVTHRVRDSGPTPIPLISWVYYVLFSVFAFQVQWWWRVAMLAGLSLVYLSCHRWLPHAVARRIEDRREQRASA